MQKAVNIDAIANISGYTVLFVYLDMVILVPDSAMILFKVFPALPEKRRSKLSHIVPIIATLSHQSRDQLVRCELESSAEPQVKAQRSDASSDSSGIQNTAWILAVVPDRNGAY